MDLKNKIQNVGPEKVARELNMSIPMLREKSSDLNFTVGELFKLKSILHLNNMEACNIFCL